MSQVQLEGRNDAPENAILSVRNLGVSFRGETSTVVAVSNVSFDVYQSEILSIVGESGSGKTTIARSIMGLVRPTRGWVKYKGEDVASMNGAAFRSYLRDVQMIFQDPFESLNPRQDVFTTIEGPIRYLLNERRGQQVYDIASQVLMEVGLDPAEVMYRYPHQLSGGQRQRVSVARALASNPKLLLADEPITMLDAAQRLNVLSLLRELKTKRKLSVVLITHDLASARLLSDRTVVLYKGRAFEMGDTESVVTRPHHPYTELILSAMPSLQAAIPEGQGRMKVEATSIQSKGCVFRAQCNYATTTCAEVEPELAAKSHGRLAACHNPLNT